MKVNRESLRRDFSPLGITVEQLTGAVEIDSFEEDLLAGEKEQKTFDILVATPEKLQLVIRNKQEYKIIWELLSGEGR